MGRFDGLRINAGKLPLTMEERQQMKKAVFQAKELERCLLLYEISDDGEHYLLHKPQPAGDGEAIPVLCTPNNPEELKGDWAREWVAHTDTCVLHRLKRYLV